MMLVNGLVQDSISSSLCLGEILKEQFIEVLNRNLNLQRFKVLFVTGNSSGITKSTASQVHGAGDKKRFQSNVKIKDVERINGELKAWPVIKPHHSDFCLSLLWLAFWNVVNGD
jgi:hypothetical protein